MLVRIDANAPRAAIEMALAFAATNGFAVDFRSFGPAVVAEPSVKPSVKPSPKATRKASPKPSAKKPKASKTPEVRPVTIKDSAMALRRLAESGSTKLPRDVYADLRSKDVVRMTAAVKAASLLLNPEERWCDRDPSTLMMALRAHEEFLHGNPLLDSAK